MKCTVKNCSIDFRVVKGLCNKHYCEKRRNKFIKEVKIINKNKNEVWKKIKEFPGYQISNIGNIKSFKFKNKKDGHIMNKAFMKGYYLLSLRKNMKTYKILVHRLVAQAFISNPENKPEVNHKDCNGMNNNIENLEWVTHQENMIHCVENNRTYYAKGIEKPQRKLTEKQVLDIKKNYNPKINIMKDFAEKYDVSRETIGLIIRGKKWKHIKI